MKAIAYAVMAVGLIGIGEHYKDIGPLTLGGLSFVFCLLSDK